MLWDKGNLYAFDLGSMNGNFMTCNINLARKQSHKLENEKHKARLETKPK